MSASPTEDRVVAIFSHWKTTHEHPRAVLDKKRRALINAALKSYGEQELKDAISGYKNSPHHTGINDRNTPYDTIELMLRDAKHIDMGLKFFLTPPIGKQAAPRELTAEEREWQQLRDEAGSEGFRQPFANEPIEKYRAALGRYKDARAKEAMQRLQAMTTGGERTA